MFDEISEVNWIFATENHDDDFHTDISFLRVIENEFFKGSGIRHSKVLMNYQGTDNQLFFSEEESLQLSSQVIKEFCSNPDWRSNLHYQIRHNSERLISLYKNMGDDSVNQLSTNELFSLYKAQNTIKADLYFWGWIMETMSASENSIDIYLKNCLLEMGVQEENVEVIFSNLLFCHEASVFEQERLELQKVLDYCLKHNITTVNAYESHSKVCYMVDRIFARFKYLYYHGYNAKRPSRMGYYQLLNECIKNKEVIYNSNIKAIHEERFGACCNRYNLSKELRRTFVSYAKCGVTKSIRRLAELVNFYYLDKIISVIAKKFDVAERIIRFMTIEEVLSIPIMGEETVNAINKRSEKMIYYYNGIQEHIITDIESINLISEVVAKNEINENIVKGTVVCPGIIIGKVYVVNKSTEVIEVEKMFEKGDILVSYEPNPDFISIIRISGAVVTDQGGMTCHVASIARELNIPCIVGTMNATSIFKTGDYITVDAYQGMAWKGEQSCD